MPDVSKLRLDNVTYDIKDDNARKYLVMVNEEPVSATKMVIETDEEADGIELAYQKDVDNKTGWFVTPEMYGAKGDGTTDDTGAIQSALNSGANVIFSPGKTYKITNRLTPTNGQDIDLNDATVKLMLVDRTAPPNIVFYLGAKDGVKIHGGKLVTNWDSCSSYNTQVLGIYGGGAKNCEIYGMYFPNLGVENTPSGTTQVSFGLDNTLLTDCYGNRIHDCTFDAVYDSFNVRIGSDWKSVQQNEVYGNIVDHCLFKYAAKSCVEISGNKTHHCKAVLNTVVDCGTEAMDIDKNASFCEISGNMIMRCSGSSEVPGYVPYGGISVQTFGGSDGVSGYYAHDNIVSNNIISETVGAGIYIKGVNTVCKGNIVKSALNGMVLSGDTVDGTTYAAGGDISGNILNGTNFGIQIESGSELDIHDNVVVCPDNAIYCGAGISESNYNIHNNVIHHGSYGIYANTTPKVMIKGNTFLHDQTHEGAKRAINALRVPDLRIMNNSAEDITGTTFVINVPTTTDFVQITDNKLPAGATIDIIGTGTIAQLITHLNSVNPSVNNTVTITKWLRDIVLGTGAITSESSSFALGSKAFITTIGNTAKISLVGTVSASIPTNTKIASVQTGLEAATEQLVTGFVTTTNGTVGIRLLLQTDGSIYSFAGTIPAGSLACGGMYIIN